MLKALEQGVITSYSIHYTKLYDEAVAGRDIVAVINVQGDEPLIDPALIDELAGVIATGEWDMATAATPIEDERLIAEPSVVKARNNFV